MPASIFVIPSRNPRPDLGVIGKFQEIDWIGAVLFAATVVLFTISLTFSGLIFSWNAGGSIASWVSFGICFIAFIIQQAFAILTSEHHRIFPLHFLRSRTLVILFIVTCAGGAAEGVMLYFIPLYFQFIKGDTALQAAVHLLPFICFFIFFVMLAGSLPSALSRYNIYYFIGSSLILIGGGLCFTISENTSVAKIYGYEAITASGIGLLFQLSYTIAVAKVDPKEVPKAICYINISQIGTVALALAIAGSLFQNIGVHELEKALAGHDISEDFIRSALAGTISPVLSSDDGEVIRIAITALASTIRKILIMVATAGAVGVLSSVFLWKTVGSNAQQIATGTR